MKKISDHNKRPATLLAFALIPLSGFALDVYIPSLPDMATSLHAAPSSIQFTLSVFLISLGICQLLVGSFLDSFGRYWPTVISLGLFSAASFAIATSSSLNMVYAMRALQGLAVATIIVSKRAVFTDLYTGEKLKQYTSMFSVIWAAAPVIAPFIGGFLQVRFGWRSNFIFLGFWALMFLVLELCFDGETLRKKHPFHLRSISEAYATMIKAKDFSMGLVILGICYSMIMVYGMTSPFLIENVLHFSPTVTGNASLVSGLSVMMGGIVSRRLIGRPFFRKVLTAAVAMETAGFAVLFLASNYANFYTLLAYVVLMHFGAGFVFNSIFSYVLTRFPSMGGKASGLAGGTYIVLTSAISQILVSVFAIKTQVGLGLMYLTLTLIFTVIFISTKWLGSKKAAKSQALENAIQFEVVYE